MHCTSVSKLAEQYGSKEGQEHYVTLSKGAQEHISTVTSGTQQDSQQKMT
jgi:hypothetical protein